MDNMLEPRIKETIASIFRGVEGLAETKKVVGEPVVVGNTTIIPFIETTMGFGVGDNNEKKEVAGAGCKVKPIACLIVQDGFTKLITIDNQDYLSKAVDMIPDLVDKLIHGNRVDKKVNDAIEGIKADYDD